jgi:SAM-dependent methyltransferase
VTTIYDGIGHDYAHHRRPDPRLAAVIHDALGGSSRIVNVGAGTGSYEPRDRDVVAVEPSAVMISQRPAHAAPAVPGRAERLPFGDGEFEAALAVLTVHHWDDVDAGIRELRRVATGPVVILAIDGATFGSWWLPAEYAPELRATTVAASAPQALAAALGPDATVRAVPVPARCTDAFLMAYWDRPELVLDPAARAATSGFARMPDAVERRIVAAVRADLDDGSWDRRHGHLRSLDEFDSGLRLVVSPKPTATTDRRDA